MRQYGEIPIAEEAGYQIREMAEGLLGLLLCVGSTLFLLFLAGGL
ncbi:MAG: hypothetical protein ACM3US_00270 [Sphingomonadaceae bacterium]